MNAEKVPIVNRAGVGDLAVRVDKSGFRHDLWISYLTVTRTGRDPAADLTVSSEPGGRESRSMDGAID